MKWFTFNENKDEWESNYPDPSNLADGFDKSIEKWEILASGDTRIKLGNLTCGLCNLYFNNGECNNCPIFETTALNTCMGTPYYEYVEVDHNKERLKEIAAEEVVFLKQLKDEYCKGESA